MRFGTQAFIWRRKITGYIRRRFNKYGHPLLVRSGGQPPQVAPQIIWSTLAVASRPDELAIVRGNLERLQPVLAWASLTLDGHSSELARFVADGHAEGFQNVLWFSKPEVVSQRGHGQHQGHFNRISLNYLRGWLSNLETGPEVPAELFCHSDGDWEVTIRPESLLPLTEFFNRYPQVVAITRNIDDFLVDEPGMWRDEESDGRLWFGRGMLSTNLIISPIERFLPLVQKTWEAFHDTRSEFLEETMRVMVAESDMVVAYPTLDYFRDHFFIDVVEKRKPFEAPA
jgi:hypothetical protein